MSNASPKDPAPCHCCAHLFRLIFAEVTDLKEHTEKISRFILNKEAEETIYRDAVYVLDRVGISDSTLLRCQRKGQINVAKLSKGKKQFRDQDVERLRREYWGLEG
ncbi:hypothetical protein GCM10023231_12640 [Olivibacter ginsenosidimutans]|uniref:Helix-turn-helix domain-containing protein n=1 Tax=Olivibacter ginsenosidimutans TaxID=1176537 RepID=A0ABP9AUR7_9SPHI